MRYTYLLKWCVLAVGVFLGLFLIVFQVQNPEQAYANKNFVYWEEVSSMFSVVDITEEEIDMLFQKESDSIVTWDDVYKIYDTLGYSQIVEKRGAHPVLEAVPREHFVELYRNFLQINNLETEDCSFVYLGMVPDEDKIITNTGNFETALEDNFFTYGEKYTGICIGNQLLLIRQISVSADAVKTNGLSGSQGETVANIENPEILHIPSTINVVLTNDNGQEAYRDTFQIKISSGCSVSCGTKKETFEINKVFTEKNLRNMFEISDVVMIIPEVNQTIYLKEADSGQWSAAYRGIFYIYKNKDMYYLVNQLPIEEYLYGVVPGEMPERFHIEALKAQAVCARTYAYNMILSDAYKEFHADVDDSVNCQVYNKNGENEKATQAVNDTAQMVLLESYNGEDSFEELKLAEAYYFSTSCGFTSGLEAWGNEARPYLQSVTTLKQPCQIKDWSSFLKNYSYEAYDSGSNVFRWQAELSLPEGCQISIDERQKSGVVTKVRFKTGAKTWTVETEYAVRKELSAFVTKMTDAEGQILTSMGLLPSAWFVIERGKGSNVYLLYGGGYGHGIGMCQYGANGMGKDGYRFTDILEYYYTGIIIKNLYNN